MSVQHNGAQNRRLFSVPANALGKPFGASHLDNHQLCGSGAVGWNLRTSASVSPQPAQHVGEVRTEQLSVGVQLVDDDVAEVPRM
jgi:hypothetical protein